MITPHASTTRTGGGRRVSITGVRLLSIALTTLLVVTLAGFTRPASLHARSTAVVPAPKIILGFQTMIGNSGPYVGAAGTLRGIPAGGAPWKIASATGLLKTNGSLVLTVKGLVLLNGTNPVPFFEGAISCQSIATNGQANIVNVFTPNFPATAAGNSVISTTVTLPSPCFAPIIFVTSPAPGQSWFAVTGM